MQTDPDDIIYDHDDTDNSTYWAHEQAYWDALRDAHEAQQRKRLAAGVDPNVDPNFVPTLQPPPGTQFPWPYEDLTNEEIASRLAFMDMKTTQDMTSAVQDHNYQVSYDHYYSILTRKTT